MVWYCRWDCCLSSGGFGVRRDVGGGVGWCWNGVDVRVGLGFDLGVLELGAVVETGACVGVGRWGLL